VGSRVGTKRQPAVALAVLSVIPSGNLLLAFVLALALAVLSVIPSGNLLLAFVLALAVLSVIPEGNLLLAFVLALALAVLSVIPEGNLLFTQSQPTSPHQNRPTIHIHHLAGDKPSQRRTKK
jgi:hypothetical protein